MLSQLFPFFFRCWKISSKYPMQPHQSTEMAPERATSHIRVTHPPCLFWLPPWENVNRSTTLIYSMWVMSSHYLFMREISQFHPCHASVRLQHYVSGTKKTTHWFFQLHTCRVITLLGDSGYNCIKRKLTQIVLQLYILSIVIWHPSGPGNHNVDED